VKDVDRVAGARVAEQAIDLRRVAFGGEKRTARRCGEQVFVRHGLPEVVRETRSDSVGVELVVVVITAHRVALELDVVGERGSLQEDEQEASEELTRAARPVVEGGVGGLLFW